MDYNSLMEEARAKQEEKTKKLAKMREQQKRNEIEQQKRSEVEQLRKVQEKQKQTKLNRVNRINQTSNQLHTTNRDKQRDLKTKHNRTTLEENNRTKKPDTSKKTNDSVKTTTTPSINNLITKVKPVNKTTTTTTTTQPSLIHTDEAEKNKVSTKAITKKQPYNYTELMEMATRNNERKFGQTKDNKFNNIHIPKANLSKTEEKTVKPESNEKRKIPEDLSTIQQTQTQTQTKKQKMKDTSLDKKKAKIEPKEEPKPRRQIEPSDFFKKTFDKSPLTKKPIPSLHKLKTKLTASRPTEQTSEEDDDFIVSDDDNPGFNVSAFIQNMFGYNKNKYADEDAREAGESMVASYTQQQYEERRSARIGKLEDLEDMRREEEALKKIASRKKKNKGLKRLQ